MWLLLYNLLFLPVAAGFLVAFALSGRRRLLKTLPSELAQRLGRYPADALDRLAGREIVWFHAASIGEVKAVQPLVAAVRQALPKAAVVLTSSNSPAREQAAKTPAIEAALLAPLDLYPVAAAAVAALNPRALVIAETELWPSLLAACRSRGVPVAVVNGRMSERSRGRYALARGLFGPAIASLRLVCAKSEADAERFRSLGAPMVATVGNLKYDKLFDDALDLGPVRERLAALGWPVGAPVLAAGSTNPGEEPAVLEAWLDWRRRDPSARLALAPRHLERLPEVERLLEGAGVSWARWTEPRPADCLLVDAIGILPSLYGVARAAFVGGTLVPRGGHNLLEPVRHAVPVLFGPHTGNLPEVAELLRRSGGGFEVADAAALKDTVRSLLGDPARCREAGKRARDAAETLRGAAARTLPLLLPLLG